MKNQKNNSFLGSKRHYLWGKAGMILLSVFLLVSGNSFASHFRYGLVTATRLSETSTTVTYRLNVSLAWRLATAPTSALFRITGGNTGSVSVPMSNVTDPSGGWTNSSGSANVTLNKTTALTRIEYTSCCKISTLINNRDRSWDVYTILNTGAGGNSPVSTLPAIINMPVGAAPAVYTIPASDPDPGSTLTYGVPNFTTGPLAGQSNPAGFSVNTSTGQISFNTVGKSVGQLYNAMVTVTDNNGNQVMLDFIINIVGPSTPPAFDYAVTPLNGAVYNVIAGQNISFLVRATDGDAGSSVSLSVSGLPAYITVSNFSSNPLPATGNPSVTTFNWTPGGAQIGHTVVLNLIATDNVGVQSTTSVTIKVVAEPAPVFIAPTPGENSIRQIITGYLLSDVIVAQSPLGSNVSIAFASGIPAGATLTPTLPTPGANPSQSTLEWIPAPSDFGVHTLSFQATIASIPTIFSTRTYQLIVNSLPAFASAPVTSVLVNEPYTYSITVTDADIPYGDVVNVLAHSLPSWLTLTSTGNGTAVLSGTPSAGDVGTHSITLEAEDLNHIGNPAHIEQDFVITVIEPAPVALCKNIAVQLDQNGSATITAADVDNGSHSLVGISSMTVSPSVFNCGNLGANAVQLVVFNSYGNSDTCTAIVTVTDVLAPVLSGVPADATVSCDNITPAGLVSANDNCSAELLSYSTPGIKTKLIHHWKAENDFTDAVGGANGVSTGSVSFGPGILGSNSFSFDGSVGYISTGVAGSVTGSGNFSVSAWIKTNSSAPMVIIQQRDAGYIGEYILKIGGNHNNGDVRPGKVYFLAYGSGSPVVDVFSTTIVNDGKWHHVIAEKEGSLVRIYIDGTLSASGSTVVPVYLDGTISTTIGRDVRDNASNFNGLIDDIRVWSAASCPSNYEFDRVWLASDASGNQSASVQHVTVVDNTAPVLACPGDITVNNTTGQCGADVSFEATATDNCGTATVTYDIASGSYFAVGTSTVTVTATDACGNSSQCSFMVTVVDSELPVIICPGDISVTALRDDCNPVITWGNVTASDNCSATVTSTHNSGDRFPVGTTTVIYTATDPSGNSVSRSFNVTVTPEPLVGSLSAKTYAGGYNISCNGAADGEVTVTVLGGCLPYTYLWSPSGQTTATAAGLSAGVNSVVITDANGTSITLSITLTEPTQLVADAGSAATVYYGYNPSGCTTLNASATGGVGPYTFAWNTGATTASITECPSATTFYTITVTDANGCVSTDVVKVCVIDVRCEKGGKAIVYYEGGKVLVCHVPAGDEANRFTICISQDAVSDHLAHGDALGICGVDANCANPARTTKQQFEFDMSRELGLMAYPNPFMDNSIIRFYSSEETKLNISVYNMLGEKVSTLFEGNVLANEMREEILSGGNLPHGVYFVKMIDSNGNTKTERVVLTR